MLEQILIKLSMESPLLLVLLMVIAIYAKLHSFLERQSKTEKMVNTLVDICLSNAPNEDTVKKLMEATKDGQ